MPDQFSDVHRSISPSSAVQQQVIRFCPFTNAHGLNVWRWWLLVKCYVLAVGNAVWGWQSLSETNWKQNPNCSISVSEWNWKDSNTLFKCKGASFLFVFSSSRLPLCLFRWGRYQCQQVRQIWRCWPYNRSSPCMPINHTSLATNSHRIKLFEIGNFFLCVCVKAEATCWVLVFFPMWSGSDCNVESIFVQSAFHSRWIEVLST